MAPVLLAPLVFGLICAVTPLTARQLAKYTVIQGSTQNANQVAQVLVGGTLAVYHGTTIQCSFTCNLPI